MSKFETEAFGLTICSNGHTDIRRIKREYGAPSIHGNKFWKSSYVLMDYLQEFPVKKGCRVLEVGCGWGLGGIFLAKKYAAKVTALDADDTVFPYLHFHADINGVGIETWKTRYEKVRQVDLEKYDLVIGADICFWDTMSTALFNLIRRAQRAGGVRAVIADPGRPPFRDMAEKAVDKLGVEYLDWHVAHPHNASGLILDMPAYG